MLRAETRALPAEARSSISAWLAAAVAAPRALLAPSVEGAADPAAAPAPSARTGSARLAQGPTASPLTALPDVAQQTQPDPAAPAASPGARARTSRAGASPAPSTPPEPATSPAPAEPPAVTAPAEPPAVTTPAEPPAPEPAPPGTELAADVDLGIGAAPVDADLLLDLSPGDFQGSLGAALPVGSAGAGVDLQLQEGALAVDTSLRVETPGLGVSTPAAAGAQLQLEPSALASELALGAGGAGAAVRLDAGPEKLASHVALDVAGTPAALAVATGSDHVAVDLSSGDLVPALLGGNEVEVSTEKLLPVDLPLDLELRLH